MAITSIQISASIAQAQNALADYVLKGVRLESIGDDPIYYYNKSRYLSAGVRVLLNANNGLLNSEKEKIVHCMIESGGIGNYSTSTIVLPSTTTTPLLLNTVAITDLTDGPGGTLLGQELKILRVNSAGTAWEFVTESQFLTIPISDTPQTLTGPGAVNLTSHVTWLVTTGADAITLAAGTEGLRKTIRMKTDGGDATLTVTNGEGFSTIVFESVGEFVELFYTDGKWQIIKDSTAWINVVFSAGDFSALGGGTWTVASGDVSVFKYKIIGKTMFVTCGIATSTIASNPIFLTVKIPNSKVSKNSALGGVLFYDDGTTSYQGGFATVPASGTTINLALIGGPTTVFTNGTDDQIVSFTAIFEIE